MKVIHLIGGGDTGGAKTHVLNLLRELNNHIDAKLFCFMRGEFSEEAERMNIPITIIDTRNPMTELKLLKQAIGDETVDLIHCHGARGNLMGALIKKHVNAPMITTVHSDYRLDYMGRPAARFSYGTTYMITMRRADYYIGVSDPMTELLIDRNFPANKIYTIYNGIDFKTPIQCSSRAEFFRSINFKVDEGDIVAGIVARLNPVKDIPTLLRAMQLACVKVPNLKLALAGDGEDREKLENMAEELGIADRVCFAGWLSDINSFYNAIDINLLTSISETFPYALTEGTRMHLATIASRVGGIPILINDGENGFIFEPRDHKQLADRLVTLATDHALREQMGERLYEKSSRMFSIDKMVETQLEIYDSALRRTRRQSQRKRDGIIICGAYGHGNAGDDAILQSIIQSVRSADPYMPVTILAKNTLNIKKKFRLNAIYTFDMPRMFFAMRHSLLYINGGGSLIQNITSSRSLAYYLLTLTTAHITKNKVYMYGCGIGPIIGQKNIRNVTKVLNRSVDAITLREPHSMNELKYYGVTGPKLQVTSDPALILTPADPRAAAAYLEKQGLDPKGHYICLMLRHWPGFSKKAQSIAACADKLYETKGLTPVFLSMNALHDTAAALEVADYMHAPHHILDDPLEPEMLIAVLSYMEVVAGMRLHGLIFSSMSGTPLVGISYDPKINSYMDYLGYGECIDLQNVTEANLLSALNREYACLGDREQRKENARQIARRERQNIHMVKELLGMEDDYSDLNNNC